MSCHGVVNPRWFVPFVIGVLCVRTHSYAQGPGLIAKSEIVKAEATEEVWSNDARDPGGPSFEVHTIGPENDAPTLRTGGGGPCGSSVLTQNVAPNTVTEGLACVGVILPDNIICFSHLSSFARSYDLQAYPELMDQDFVVECVDVGVRSNMPGPTESPCFSGPGGDYVVTLNIYQDTNGGAPEGPGTDLILLGSQAIVVPLNTTSSILRAVFDPPVRVSCNMVVELRAPDRNPASGGDGGIFSAGTNALGETDPSYIRAPQCGASSFVTFASVGFGQMNLVQSVHGSIANSDWIDLNDDRFREGPNITGNPRDLASGGTSVTGLVADGVTPVLLRLGGFHQPGTLQITVVDEYGSTATADVGTLHNPVTEDVGNPLTVDLVPISGTSELMGFAALTAPEDFVRPAHAELDSLRGQNAPRELIVDVQYNRSDGVVQELCPRQISLYRPPVVLLHGLWGNSGMWRWPLQTDPRFTVYAHGYKGRHAYSLGTNIQEPRAGVAVAVEMLRGQSIAATQADVIAHSMGGLLSRLYIADVRHNYYRNDNFTEGDIHKLITLDSPHHGSPFANVLLDAISRPFFGPWFARKMRESGHCIECGAVDDLRADSPVIAGMPAAVVAAHAIAGTGGSDLVAQAAMYLLPAKIRLIFTILEWLGYPPEVIFAALGIPEHDLVVGVESQQAGLTGGHVTTVGKATGFTALGTIHFGVPAWISNEIGVGANPQVGGVAVDLLNARVTDTAVFAPGFPANRSAKSRRVDPQRFGRGDGGIQITSPLPGAIFSAGAEIPVTVETTGGFVPASVLVVTPGDAQVAETSPFEVVLHLPEDGSGPLTIGAVARDADDNLVLADDLVVQVTFAASLTGISVNPSTLYLFAFAPTQAVTVMGSYDDGVDRDLTSASLGTTYETSDPQVATVDGEGVVTGHRVGSTVITATNGAHVGAADAVVGTAFADYDRDGDVDLRDFAAFMTCFSGPAETPGFLIPEAACRDFFDTDTDFDVDLDDFSRFHGAFTAPSP